MKDTIRHERIIYFNKYVRGLKDYVKTLDTKLDLEIIIPIVVEIKRVQAHVIMLKRWKPKKEKSRPAINPIFQEWKKNPGSLKSFGEKYGMSEANISYIITNGLKKEGQTS